jgi:hypothetical protein
MTARPPIPGVMASLPPVAPFTVRAAITSPPRHAATRAFLAGQQPVSAAQAMRLVTISRGSGYTNAALSRLLRHYGYARARDVRACDYEVLCNRAGDAVLGVAFAEPDVPAVEQATGQRYRAHVQAAEPAQIAWRRTLSRLRNWELRAEADLHANALHELAGFYRDPRSFSWATPLNAQYHAEHMQMALDELLFRLGRYEAVEAAALALNLVPMATRAP